MNIKYYDTIILGAGASGMTSAIFAAGSGQSVCVVEHRSEPGKKLLQTGNGKCNLTHENICSFDYPENFKDDNMPGSGGDGKGKKNESPVKEGYVYEFLDTAFGKFGFKKTVEFFNTIGIPVRNKGGYIYPYSGTALSVRNALWDEMKRLGVEIITGEEPDLKIHDGEFSLYVRSLSHHIKGKRLILATGLKAFPGTGSDGSGLEIAKKAGINIKPVLPALVKLKCKDKICGPAAGVRHICSLIMNIGEANGSKYDYDNSNETPKDEDMVSVTSGASEKYEETGEVQFTDDGISGIPVFNLSRYASIAVFNGRKVSVTLDLVPDFNNEECRSFIERNFEKMKDRKIVSLFGGWIHPKLLTAVARTLSISAEKKVVAVGKEKLLRLVRTFKAWEMEIDSTYGFESAQVCTGGVDVSLIDPETMEVRSHPGIFVTGEICDIDGPCGGYNLQWAWTSGAIAGMFDPSKQ